MVRLVLILGLVCSVALSEQSQLIAQGNADSIVTNSVMPHQPGEIGQACGAACDSPFTSNGARHGIFAWSPLNRTGVIARPHLVGFNAFGAFAPGRMFSQLPSEAARQSVHIPYVADEFYYYDRPYQYRQSGNQEVGYQQGIAQYEQQDLMRLNLNRHYELRKAVITPPVGDIGSLEFADQSSVQRIASRKPIQKTTATKRSTKNVLR